MGIHFEGYYRPRNEGDNVFRSVRPSVRPPVLRAAVDNRGSALPGAAKSEEESLSVQGVCLCVE